MRGGIILQHQRFNLIGSLVPIINIQLPISEGLIDRRYAFLGMWIIKKTLQINLNAFALGMGGMDQPLPKLLQALDWTVRPIPFFFYVHNVATVLRGLPKFQRTFLGGFGYRCIHFRYGVDCDARASSFYGVASALYRV